MAAAAAWAGIVLGMFAVIPVTKQQEKTGDRALGQDSLLTVVAVRVELFLWKSYCIADSAAGRECHCVLRFITLAGEPPILCRSKKC